ncbi:MAG: hemagglutinin repeat-containing protein, partial [Pseudomonadales bacterium]
VVNTDVVINEHYDETGTVRYSHVESCNRGKDHCRRTGGASPYSEVREIATADFFTGSAKSNTNVDNSSASVDGLSAAANAVFNSQFFQKNIDDATKPLIETDPQFTNYRTWLSSDYALQNLPLAPGVSQQRLGDGYVEQRLIQQQVMAQTGRRFIGSYTSDEEQYRALMNNGVDIAQQYNWMPGLALDETQIAALTQDIVWLEQRDITLADGRVVQVLAPQLYRAVSEGDISGSGALLSGRSVSIDATGTLSNAGVINAAEQLIVSADQIESTGGGFGASDVALNSQGDIALTSSVVAAKSAVSLKAQGDITLATDVVEKSTNVAGNTVITRSLQQTAGIQLSDAGAQLTLESAGDIELRGARIENRGENSTTAITAAGDVSLTTVESGRDSQIRWDADNSLDDSDSREHGSSLVVDDLTISAQGDIALRAVSVEAEGELKLAADGSVSIEEGRAKQRTEQHRKITKSSAFGKKTTIAHFENETDQALLSNLQAEQLSIEAAESIDIQGANLVSQQDLTLKAEEGVNVASAQNHQRTYDYSVTKKSGLMSGGSFGVSLGKRSQLDQVETRSTTQVSSTLGSLSGDVNLTAGETLSVKGSELLAREQDINLQAADVELEPADDTRSLSERHEFKQSGLTLALTGGAISAVQSIDASVKTAKQTDNKKLQALHAWKVKNALEGLPGQLEGASELIQNPSEESLESSGMSLSLSLGSSSSTQTREQQSTTALGTSVQAEGDIKITATGVAGDSSSGDIDARGALIEGRNVTLNAANDINLQSAENTERDDSTSSSSSAGIGVSIGSGGLQFTVNASRSRGLENQSSDRYLESQIKARETASLTSGNDTSLTGAQIDAERIELDVGGDLNITSQQDQEAYRKRQESFGLSAGFGVGGSPITASINGSKLKADSNYRAVQQQSGLFAGEGGYQVQVGGNTALVGGAIVSDADASQNSLDTETLSLAKVENSAEYSIDAKSFGFSTNPAEGGGIDKAVSGGLASDEGSSANTTYAAISEGEVTVRANPEIDLAAQTALKRSQAEAHQVLARIFDKSQVQAVEDELAVQQILSQEVPKAIGDYAQKQMDKIDDLLDLAEKADAEQNSARANQLRAEISQIEANWGEQGEYRVLLHTLSGALSGNLQGAVGALATAVAVPELASTFDEMGLSDTQKGALLLLASGAIGAVANGDIGAVNSVGQAANNYLDHEEDQRRIQFKRERYELERKLASEECDDANSCQEYATRLAEVTAEIVELSKLDNKRDIDLSSACKDSPTSQKCLRELAKLEVAARSYADNKAKPEADSDMLSTLAQFGTEQRNLTTLVAAGAIAKIGVDTVEGTIELAKLAGLASIGNEQAQQELYAIAVQLKDFVSDPVGNIDSHTKQQLELAAQHRANGDEVAAQQVELELAYNYIFSATGLAGTAAQIPKGVIRAAGRSETSNSSSSEPNEGVETTGEHGQNDDAQGEVVTAETDTNLPPDNGRLELPSGWKKVDGKTYDAEGFEVALKEGENGYWVRVNSGTEGNAGGNTTSTSTGGVPGGSAASSQLNVTDYTLPNGKVTQVASDGNAIVQLDKIEKFAQGNLPNVTTERRLLDQFKQKNRKEFDADPANAERLDLLKRQESNFKRSNAMRQNLERVGLTDTPANNQIIMEHLLDVGNKINSDNRVWFPSVLKGPN